MSETVYGIRVAGWDHVPYPKHPGRFLAWKIVLNGIAGKTTFATGAYNVGEMTEAANPDGPPSKYNSSLHAWVDQDMARRRAHYWLANDADVVDVYELSYTAGDVNALDGPVVRLKRAKSERIVPLEPCACRGCETKRLGGQHRQNDWGWIFMPPNEARAHMLDRCATIRAEAIRAGKRHQPDPATTDRLDRLVLEKLAA